MPANAHGHALLTDAPLRITLERGTSYSFSVREGEEDFLITLISLEHDTAFFLVSPGEISLSLKIGQEKELGTEEEGLPEVFVKLFSKTDQQASFDISFKESRADAFYFSEDNFIKNLLNMIDYYIDNYEHYIVIFSFVLLIIIIIILPFVIHSRKYSTF